MEMVDGKWWDDGIRMTWNYKELGEVDAESVEVLWTGIKIQVTQGSAIEFN